MASLILYLSSNNGPMIAFTSDLGSKPTGSLDTAVEGLCPPHRTSHLSTLARTRINKAKTWEKKESVTILGNPRDKDRTNPWSHLQKIKNQFKYCHVKIVMSSLPQARPQSKAGAALGPCLGHGPLWGLGYHFLAPSGSMEQQTGFAVSSNSFRLLVASFATLFLALSFSSFKNSRRVNFHRAFWETGKHNQVNAFYVPPRCRHLAPSLPAPSNTRNTGPSRARSQWDSGCSQPGHPFPGAGPALQIEGQFWTQQGGSPWGRASRSRATMGCPSHRHPCPYCSSDTLFQYFWIYL